MRSLYRRMTVTHTLVALLAVLLVALLASGLIVRAYRQTVESQALRQSRLLAERLRGPLAQIYIRNRGWEGAAAQIGSRLAERDTFEGRLVLADAQGRVVFDSAGELEGRPAPPRLLQGGVPVTVRGQVVGLVAVAPGEESRREADRAFVRSLAWIVLTGSVAAGVVALVVALLVARRLVTPLRELTVAARRLAARERHEPIVPPADAELADLAHAFNSMAAELGRQEELRRQMVADIAHELRTPLSVLRLQVESMEDAIVPVTPQTLGALGGELDLLARLVDDLRLLSLAEAGQLSLAPQAVDPHEALAHTAQAATASAHQRGVHLQLEPSSPLPAVRADPQRLTQILANLVENALRYTPAGGTVTLRVRKEESGKLKDNAHAASSAGILFEVCDTGPGIAPADLPHIFDRFYRTDRARARETGGSGLGLAIVQRLVLAQGGTVSVASEPGRGTTFRVMLPLA